MPKAKKHYLEKKIEGLDQKYSKIPDQYSELKNIYRGKDKSGKKNHKLHKLKDRYDAAEAYLQTLDKQNLIPEQRKYLCELARTFSEYDLKLDEKRKEPEYKEAVRKKRMEHLGKTLEAMAEDEAPAQTPKTYSTTNKTLDNYVQTPKIVTPIEPKLVASPNPSVVTTTAAGISKPSLTSKMYQSSKNAASSAYNATKGFTEKYWKYGVTFIAGAAVGSLLTYYCMTKPVQKPAPQPIKQEQVIPKYVNPKQDPKEQTPIIKKQEPKKQEPIIKKEPKKETQTPIIKEEQKPVAPEVEDLLTEKDWTNKVKKGEIDLTKYDVFFSGMWYDPGAIVAYEKGTDKIKFDTAMSGQLMWDKVETKKELEDLVWVMEKNNMSGQDRIALRAEYVKDKDGKILGVIFTDALNQRVVNLKDSKVMVYSVERHMLDRY